MARYRFAALPCGSEIKTNPSLFDVLSSPGTWTRAGPSAADGRASGSVHCGAAFALVVAKTWYRLFGNDFMANSRNAA